MIADTGRRGEPSQAVVRDNLVQFYASAVAGVASSPVNAGNSLSQFVPNVCVFSFCC